MAFTAHTQQYANVYSPRFRPPYHYAMTHVAMVLLAAFVLSDCARAYGYLDVTNATAVSAFVGTWLVPDTTTGRARAFFTTDGNVTTTYMTTAAYQEGPYRILGGTANSRASAASHDGVVIVADAATETVYTSWRRGANTRNEYVTSNGNPTRRATRTRTSTLVQLPDEYMPIAPTVAANNTRRRARCTRERSASGLTVVRVGVMHTPQAAALPLYAAHGGSRAVEMEVAATVAEANSIVYRMSGVKIELRLCTNTLVNDTLMETASASRTLTSFTESAEVAAVRDAHACDVMVLFSTIGALGNRACGLGYMFPGAHAAVAAPCFKDNFSFVHEVGHMLGACHGDPGTLCVAGANGYGSSRHAFRTIEAYRAACGRDSASCTRIPRVSNSIPAYTWNDWPIGDARHSNAWMLNANRDGASVHRC